MDSKSTPKKKTSPEPGEKKRSYDPAEIKAMKTMFIMSALNMGWQLAAVVLIPIIGGIELSRHFNLALWEIAGFILAGLGFYVVLKQQVDDLNQRNNSGGKK